MNLPPTTHDLIFRDLSFKDLLNYSKVNKAARNAVKAFYRRALRVENVLSPYFNDDELRRLRILQYTTGFLISGSAALSFFERVIYPESDLDIYVDFRYAIFLTEFLIGLGFVFQPFQTERKQQAQDIFEALDAMDRRMETFEDENDTIEGFGEYSTTGIADVFTFVRAGKKVQIIAAGHHPGPLDVILKFHSTVVMNIISYTHAVSFYPKATFIDRVTVVNRVVTFRSDQNPPREKYEKRGWEVRDNVEAVDLLKRNSEFGMLDRHVGDKLCWAVKLPPVRDFVPVDWALGRDWMLFSNSWSLNHACGIEMDSTPFFMPNLTQSYALSSKVHKEVKKNFIFMWNDEDRPVSGLLKAVDGALADFVDDLYNEAPEQDERDAAIEEILRQAFETARQKYSHLAPTERVSASTAYFLLEDLQHLVKKMPEMPTFVFRFAQERTGGIWTNVDVHLSPKNSEKEHRNYRHSSWKINVEFKASA
ncbi:hypothetical protein Moror_4148 [Moniliophthora roreri MCA 2997]|uniref:F-box domain-containing protein n=1 Tax=Moniliophthora roreri (strain MCA 2997) TaxID=1381753 RepID=V2YG73_MONRO|nr:hypothetical protein Moror_4148 [Moniliophthora roreri MCA 2997]